MKLLLRTSPITIGQEPSATCTSHLTKGAAKMDRPVDLSASWIDVAEGEISQVATVATSNSAEKALGAENEKHRPTKQWTTVVTDERFPQTVDAPSSPVRRAETTAPPQRRSPLKHRRSSLGTGNAIPPRLAVAFFCFCFCAFWFEQLSGTNSRPAEAARAALLADKMAAEDALERDAFAPSETAAPPRQSWHWLELNRTFRGGERRPWRWPRWRESGAFSSPSSDELWQDAHHAM